QVKKALLATNGNQNLPGFVIQTVITSELFDNGLFQIGSAINRSVFGHAIVDRLDGSLFNVLRCIEVRFTRAQTNNIFSFGAKSGSSGSDGKGRRGFDVLNTLGELDSQNLSFKKHCKWISNLELNL